MINPQILKFVSASLGSRYPTLGYVCIYACVCVCVCVCEREREREKERDTAHKKTECMIVAMVEAIPHLCVCVSVCVCVCV